MRKVITGFTLLALFLFGTGTVLAEGYRWRDHVSPFDFLFGNHIDVHQQSLIEDGKLVGFLYIRFTGDFTEDGDPEARHADCANVPDECTMGWILDGILMQATYLGHDPGEHPQWYVDPDDLPAQQGYTHFHWREDPKGAGGLQEGMEYDGYLLKLTARDTFFFEHHDGFLVTPGIDEATHANIVSELP
jgi:hypothetical protein